MGAVFFLSRDCPECGNVTQLPIGLAGSAVQPFSTRPCFVFYRYERVLDTITDWKQHIDQQIINGWKILDERGREYSPDQFWHFVDRGCGVGVRLHQGSLEWMDPEPHHLPPSLFLRANRGFDGRPDSVRRKQALRRIDSDALTCDWSLALQAINEPHSLQAVRALLRAAALYAGADETIASDVELATGEALANVHHHAYDSKLGGVEVEVSLNEGNLTVSIADEGNATATPTLPTAVTRDGGYGLYLASQLLDSVSIRENPIGRGLIVRMVRKLHAQDAEGAHPHTPEALSYIFECSLKPSREDILVRPVGKVDLATAPLFQNELRTAFAIRRLVVVDLAGIQYLDVAGVRVLEDIAQHHPGRFAIAAPNPRVDRVFKILRLRERLPVLASSAAALEFLDRHRRADDYERPAL